MTIRVVVTTLNAVSCSMIAAYSDGNLILPLCFQPSVYSALSLHQRSKKTAPGGVGNYTCIEERKV